MAALDWIFSTPTFRATDFEKYAGIPVPTAKRILRLLENAEILAVIRESQRSAPPGALPGAAAGRCGGETLTPSLWIMKPRSVIHKAVCRLAVIHKPPCPTVHVTSAITS